MAYSEHLSGLFLNIFLIVFLHQTIFVDGYEVERLAYNKPLSPAIYKLRGELSRRDKRGLTPDDPSNRATETPSSTTTTPPSPPPPNTVKTTSVIKSTEAPTTTAAATTEAVATTTKATATTTKETTNDATNLRSAVIVVIVTHVLAFVISLTI